MFCVIACVTVTHLQLSQLRLMMTYGMRSCPPVSTTSVQMFSFDEKASPSRYLLLKLNCYSFFEQRAPAVKIAQAVELERTQEAHDFCTLHTCVSGRGWDPRAGRNHLSSSAEQGEPQPFLTALCYRLSTL